MKIMYGFSSHLMLDCFGCAKDKLADVNFVFDLLVSLPQKLKIAKTAEPFVFKYQGQASEEWGVSGVLLAGMAHVSIHTFPDKEQVFIDIFSAQEFDADFMVAEFNRLFSATSCEVSLRNNELLVNNGFDNPYGLVERSERGFYANLSGN